VLKTRLFTLVVCFIVLLMAGCTATKTKFEPLHESVFPSMEEDDLLVIIPAPQNKKYISTPVVDDLLAKSQRKFETNELPAAANFIERGINITPNNPLLWQRLALIRFEQRNYQQAKQLALKSNILVEGNIELRRANENIIRQANELLAP